MTVQTGARDITVTGGTLAAVGGSVAARCPCIREGALAGVSHSAVPLDAARQRTQDWAGGVALNCRSRVMFWEAALSSGSAACRSAAA